MGLLSPPPLPVGPLFQRVQVDKRIGDGVCTARGMVFAVTNTGNQERIFRWPNPYDVLTYDEWLSSSFFLISASSACYDAVNDRVYLLAISLNAGTGFNEVTVVSVNPSVPGTDTELVAQAQFGNADSAFTQPDSAICTDGTYIYVISASGTQNSWISKWQCSDGAFVSQLQLPNPTGGNAFLGTVIGVEGSTLYAAGGWTFSNGNSWAARIPTSLSIPQVITTPLSVMNDDFFLDVNYLWLADETGDGIYCKVDKDMGGATLVVNGQPGWVNGLLPDPDGVNMWGLQVPATAAGKSIVVKMSKAGVVSRVVTQPEYDLNEFVVLTGAIFAITFTTSQSGRSVAELLPLNADPGVEPRPPAGRGAAR